MKQKRLEELAYMLWGASDGLKTSNPAFAQTLKEASEELFDASKHVCAQGYYGCRSGERCTSDHK